MLQKKYGYTGKTINWSGRVYRQIVALQDISATVHKGDLGGYIEHNVNLSQSGSCWVDEECLIGGKVCISGTANVHNSFIIGGESDYIRIEGFSEVTGCDFSPNGGNVLIDDSYITKCYIGGECVISKSVIDRTDISRSCIVECIISDSDIDDAVIFSRNMCNDTEK